MTSKLKTCLQNKLGDKSKLVMLILKNSEWDNLSDETKKTTKTLLDQPTEDKSILQQAKDKDICLPPFTQVYNEIN